jgi:hypothetical protein
LAARAGRGGLEHVVVRLLTISVLLYIAAAGVELLT